MKSESEIPVEAREPLQKWEEEISKLCNKFMFLIYGAIGKYEKIREIVKFEKQKPKEDEIEKFIYLCDNRIEGLKSFSKDIITALSILVAFFGGILVGVLLRPGEFSHFSLKIIFLFTLIILFFIIFPCILVITMKVITTKTKKEEKEKNGSYKAACCITCGITALIMMVLYIFFLIRIAGINLIPEIFSFTIFSFIIFLFMVLVNHKAQTHAWYAIKEGVLLMKKNK